MKSIDTTAIPSDVKPNGFSQSTEHDRVVAAYLARIHSTGDVSDMSALHSWGAMTHHLPMMGGVHEGRYRAWLNDRLADLARIAQAADLVKTDGPRLEKELPERREEAEADIASIERMIGELNASLSERRIELAEIEGEQNNLDQARQILSTAEDGGERGDLIGMAWGFVRDDGHPFEPNTKGRKAK